ncbi:VOC family protein [Pseudophaeobacter sp.]|uniref:VOC family protein n=1 Tax=Pseudophaeobacter sp. TaxID=1971739 RepID=UPI003298A14E
MFSHVNLGTKDLEQAVAFFDAVLKPLGIEQKFCQREMGWAGWQHRDYPRPLFLVGLPVDGGTQSSGNGQMLALQAGNRQQVDQCHAIALTMGARDDGAPGLRPQYHPDYYGAYFRDLDNNKICICCHEAE